MIDPVKESDLAAAAALIPPVECKCENCNGTGWLANIYDPEQRVVCHTCDGTCVYYREMTGAEEHFYILHLLTTRYQLR